MAKKAKAKIKAKKRTKQSAPAPRSTGRTDAARLPDVFHHLRGAWGRFSRAIPAASASAGVHEPQTPVEVKGAKNGLYRVEGADWLMRVRNGVVLAFEKAHADVAEHNDAIKVPSASAN